jgi:hypothetical protein
MVGGLAKGALHRGSRSAALAAKLGDMAEVEPQSDVGRLVRVDLFETLHGDVQLLLNNARLVAVLRVGRE